MTIVRQAAVAGMFYPLDAETLHRMVQKFLDGAKESASVPKAMIGPHAGYLYSGPVAASAYVRLRHAADKISRVVLLGPSHHVGFKGLAVPHADEFATPLGAISVDIPSIQRAIALPFVRYLDQAHTLEHSLEVHLPFLQEVLKEFVLVPVAAGDARPEEVGRLLDVLWGGEETLIVVSSDLSHYHDYETSQKLDAATSLAIETLRYEEIGHESACGRVPVNGLLYAARKRYLKAKTIDLRNSGDTAGSKERVVGYGAYVFQ